MNKVATRITIVFLLILLFLTGSYTFLHWNSNNSTLGWFRQECNKNYILIGEEAHTAKSYNIACSNMTERCLSLSFTSLSLIP